jgi:hypothetical protein
MQPFSKWVSCEHQMRRRSQVLDVFSTPGSGEIKQLSVPWHPVVDPRQTQHVPGKRRVA